MHENSRLLFCKYIKPLVRPGMQVLEIGPDDFPSTYHKLVGSADPNTPTWHTLNIYDEPRLTYPNSAPYEFPVPDNRYDLVVSGQVIEHVRAPWRWMPELARVTKPGGLVATVNPVSWDYHEAPVDCWRIYPEGMRALCAEAGLTVLTCEWGSLEQPHFNGYRPGVSRECQPEDVQRANRLLGCLGLPVERAYDTVTIARK